MALTRHGKLVTLVPAALVLMLLCAGAVQATCTSGQKFCNSTCVNPQTDANNCGNCGVKCSAANAVSTCYMGKCEYECKPEFKNCDGKWENGCECEPSNDVENCGACGAKCNAPANAWAMCKMGKCEYECKPWFKNCDGKWENGCECEPSKDVDNCGACGAKCNAPANAWAMCKMGKCEYECKPGFKNCDGKWENGCECEPSKDVDNCGACGAKCNAPANAWAMCKMGKCEYGCKPWFKNCDGKFENGCECELSKDVDNCGACGVKCNAPANAWAMCKMGKCEYECKPGFKNCDGKWENGCECEPSKDVDNCGACGAKCNAPANAWAMCKMGKCEYGCKPWFKNCDGKWENGCECEPSKDVDNCGACGAKCNAPANAWAMCKMGKCEYVCKPGHKNCDGKWENGCECYPETDTKNCGNCGNKCPEPEFLGGESRCTRGKCEKACKKGLKYDNGKKRCEKEGNNDKGKHGDDDGEKGKGGHDDNDGKKGKNGGDGRH